MSRTRRKSSSPVSLFPFLAVLVSTMGALILLLVAINRRVAMQAVAKAAESVLAQTSAEEQWLNHRRRQLAEEVAVLERDLALVGGDQQRVEEQARLAAQRARSHADQTAATQQALGRLDHQRELNEQEINAIRRQLEGLDAAKARLREEQMKADRAFVPVVHPGSGGTVRQPIYVECTADSLIIQPEGIALPPGALVEDEAG